MTSLAVIIVAYGHAAVLAPTLQALVSQTVPPAEIVLVDNGDGSSAAVARAVLPRATVLVPGYNLGFAGGCALGVARTNAPLLALINPDVVLAPDWIATVTAALSDPTIGIVGSKLVYPNGRLQHAGGIVRWPLALTDHRGYGEVDRGQYATPADVAYVTGAALACSREVWTATGGLDPAFYPAYFEEVDLCLRVAAQGWRVQYLPTAQGVHVESSAVGKATLTFYRLNHLNRLRLLWKHHPDPWLLDQWLPAELLHLRTTAEDAEIAGLLWAYRQWQAVWLAGGNWQTRIDGWQLPEVSPAQIPGELGWTLDQLARKQTLQPVAFQSRWPVVATLRRLWNSIATETYLRPLIQQQNDYNAAIRDLAQALERQRRTTDAAILAQAMLMAKMTQPRG